MSIYKIAELVEKLGKPKQFFYTYKNRGKLVIQEGSVDDTIPKNKIFLDSQFSKLAAKKPTADPGTETPKPKKKNKKPVDVMDLQYNMELSEHDKLKNQNLKEDLDIKKIKKAKLLGESMSTETVHRIFSITFKTMSVEFYNAIDSYSTIMIKKVGGNRKDLAESRVILKELVNDMVNKAKLKAKEDIESAVKEFSTKSSLTSKD